MSFTGEPVVPKKTLYMVCYIHQSWKNRATQIFWGPDDSSTSSICRICNCGFGVCTAAFWSCFDLVFPAVATLFHFGIEIFNLWHFILELCNLFFFFFVGSHSQELALSLKKDFELLKSVDITKSCRDIWSWNECILHYEIDLSQWGPGVNMNIVVWVWNTPHGWMYGNTLSLTDITVLVTCTTFKKWMLTEGSGSWSNFLFTFKILHC